LSRDASIRYASDSIQVVLGYQPHEVINRSCWEYFHPDELPFARNVHGRGVRLDKAAVLNYCSIRHKDGSWVGCECVFTVVYDVLIASTTVYRSGKGSQSKS
jgi:PAS domain S-box-containing protein